MVGPVLRQELLLGGRRNQLHVFRWIYAAWLVVQVGFFFLQFKLQEQARFFASLRTGGSGYNPGSAPQVVGALFAETFVGQQLLLLVLVTPAFVAGAITDEKRKGTLQYLLTTDLDTRHIVLGKLLGRVAQVGLVALAGLPLFALLAGFAGVEPASLLFVAGTLAAPLFAVACAALLASVLCRQTRDAVLGLYLVAVAGWLAARWSNGLLDAFNPLHVLAPAWGPHDALDLAEAGRRLAVLTLCWTAVGSVCLALAVGLLRPVFTRELESNGPRRRRWYRGERVPVGDEPVHWRERHVEGLAPVAALRRVPPWLALTLTAGLTTASSLLILWLALPSGNLARLVDALAHLRLARLASLRPDASTGFLVQGVVVLLLASLVVGIRCSGAVTGERERQTWEALLLTPISAKQMIRGKMWGVMGASYAYLLAYAAPALVLSALGGLLALLWVVVCLAVTMLAMYFVGAAGLWCSVRSRSSWRSLLGTLGLGYVGGACIYVVTSPALFVLWLLLLVVLLFVDLAAGTHTAQVAAANFTTFFLISCVSLALIFWVTARLCLGRAQRWIADRDRTRHWYDEPASPRPPAAPPRTRVAS